MAFEEKKKKAIALMKEKKMCQSNYAPPILRLFWKMGATMPPPPFAPFWMNTLFSGVWFGSVWGILMWFILWQDQNTNILVDLLASFTSGLLFGLFMALFHAWRKRVNKLPSWESL